MSAMNLTNACVDVAEWFSVNYKDQTAEASVRILFAFVYVITFIFGLSGNILVISSVWRHRSLQTVRNFFIVSLSCSDIVVCLTSLPITPLTFMMKNWLFGSFLCYVFPLVQGMSVCISTFTLTAVAMDRYILIIFPTRKPIQRGQAVIMILSIWALAAAVSVPMVVHYNHFYGPDRASDQSNSPTYASSSSSNYSSQITHHSPSDSEDDALPTFCGYFCEEIWPSESIKQIYGSFVLVLQFVIPLGVISFSYARICIRLAARNDNRRRFSGNSQGIRQHTMVKEAARLSLSRIVAPDIGSGLNVCATATTAISSPTVAENRRRAVLRRQKRTNRMLIAMVVIFALCWAPQVSINILRDLESLPGFVNDQMYLYYLICHSVAMSSTIWNPILYSWMNESFRRAFMELLPCFRRIQRKWSSKTKRRMKGGQSSNLADLGSQIDPAGTTEQFASLLASDIENQNDRRKSAGTVSVKTIRSVDRSPRGRTDGNCTVTEKKPLLTGGASNKMHFKVFQKRSISENGMTRMTGQFIMQNHDGLTAL